MSAPFTIANLGRGPAITSYNGVYLYTSADINARIQSTWEAVKTSLFGTVDKFKKDVVLKIPLKLWGSYSDLGVLFPNAFLNPTIGAGVFSGSANAPLVLTARNGDQITYTNAMITKMADLHLAVDGDLFAANVEFTAICGYNNVPEDANAYYAATTGATFPADATFNKSLFKKVRWSAAWGALAGFTSFVGQKGFDIGWQLGLSPVVVDGYGTRDFTITDFIAQCKCIPIGPSIAQLEAQAQDQGVPLGTLLGVESADLTITGGGSSVVLKQASLAEHGYMFGAEPLRMGELVFETTRGGFAGNPGAVATVS